MLQRNTTDYALLVAADPPVLLEPGDVIDHEDHVAGCEPANDPEPAPVAAPTKKTAAKAAANPTPTDAEEKTP